MITKKALYTKNPIFQCEFDGDYFYTYIVYKPYDKCVSIIRKSHYGHKLSSLLLVYDLEYDLHNDIFNHKSLMDDILLNPDERTKANNEFLYFFINKPYKFSY